MKKMKKSAVILMVGLLVGMLAGCSEAKEPETADEALEQIEAELEQLIAEEEEEKAPEESLVDVYVPGTIPPGTYVVEGGTATLYIYEDKTFETSAPHMYMYGTYTYVYDEENDTYTFDMSYDVEPEYAVIMIGKYVDGNLVIFSRELLSQPDLDNDVELVYVRQ